jgi:hypothetical protein
MAMLGFRPQVRFHSSALPCQQQQQQQGMHAGEGSRDNTGVALGWGWQTQDAAQATTNNSSTALLGTASGAQTYCNQEETHLLHQIKQ